MKLSIITVNLNNREGLKKTLDSVACQTWRDFEHIIIDGASTDGSVEVIQEYEKSIANSQDPTAKTHWKSEPDTGIYNAMNKGIRMAKGEYCFFLNSGDYLVDSDVFGKVFKNTFNEDVVYGYIDLDWGDHVSLGPSPTKISLRTFIEGSLPHSGGSFTRRDAFDRWGLYDESLRIVSDKKWFLKAVGLSNATTKYLDMKLSVFDCHGINCTQRDLCEQEETLVLKELVPQRILMDYLEFHHFEEVLAKKEQDIKSTKSYKLGFCLLKPVKLLKQKFRNIKI